MNNGIKSLLLILTVLFGVNLAAQQVKSSAKKVFRPTVYLGRSGYTGGTIQKDVFDNLLKQGITSHDSLGRKYKVLSFFFTYAERSLYEDSVGNLIVTAEYLNEFCAGDTVTSAIANTIYNRTKAGDTVFFDQVQVAGYRGKSGETIDNNSFLGSGMKFVIAK